LATSIIAQEVVETEVSKLLTGMEGRRTPTSDFLFECLRLPLRDLIPGDEEWQSVFDRFEYLLALVYADQTRWSYKDGWRGPIGRFLWRGRRDPNASIIEVVGKEIETEGQDWPPIKAGLFGGNVEQAMKAKTKFDAFLEKLPIF
jgi:hypothetical protein